VKKTGNVDDTLRIFVKNSFESSIFFIYWVTGPWIFKKFNFSIELHFTHFSIFLWLDEREEVIGFRFREKKMFMVRNLATKTIIFFRVKWFYMMREVKIMCFFYLENT